MLHRCTFTEPYRRCFGVGDTFEFLPGVNLLVGEQGCGKSSLLSLLRGSRRVQEKNILKVEAEESRAFHFDFERDNPRVQAGFTPGHEVGQVLSLFRSHGQTAKGILATLGKYEGVIVCLDEPDMGLSIRSCHELVGRLQSAADRKCQIVAAVHNPVVISAFPQVLSLEHKCWMPSAEFIQSHQPVA